MPTPASPQDIPPSRFPGERLGLPERGPRSVARVGRRIAALAIDYGLAVLISLAFFDYAVWSLFLFFALTQLLFIPTIGGSIGHRLLDLQVVSIRSGYIGVWRPAVRTGLLLLALPALVWDSDQRGFHDKVAGTVLIRR